MSLWGKKYKKEGDFIPRILRNYDNSKFFHTMVQEIEKKFIFDSPNNMQKYIELIKTNSKRAHVSILSYCIMPNHAHILIYSKSIDNLIKFFRYTNTSYAKYFNFKNNRVGYVFRDRYKSKNIYTVQQLTDTINYIHNNPVKAGFCSFPEEYKYSSYNEYLSKSNIINKKALYKFFGENKFKLIFINRE